MEGLSPAMFYTKTFKWFIENLPEKKNMYTTIPIKLLRNYTLENNLEENKSKRNYCMAHVKNV